MPASLMKWMKDLLDKSRADPDSAPLRHLARGGGHIACENEWLRRVAVFGL